VLRREHWQNIPMKGGGYKVSPRLLGVWATRESFAFSFFRRAKHERTCKLTYTSWGYWTVTCRGKETMVRYQLCGHQANTSVLEAFPVVAMQFSQKDASVARRIRHLSTCRRWLRVPAKFRTTTRARMPSFWKYPEELRPGSHCNILAFLRPLPSQGRVCLPPQSERCHQARWQLRRDGVVVWPRRSVHRNGEGSGPGASPQGVSQVGVIVESGGTQGPTSMSSALVAIGVLGPATLQYVFGLKQRMRGHIDCESVERSGYHETFRPSRQQRAC